MSTPERSTSATERGFQFWADHVWLQFLTLAFFTTTAIIGYWHPEWIRSRFVGQAEPAKAKPVARRVSRIARQTSSRMNRPVQTFSYGGECILVATSDSFFTTPGVSAMRRVAERLESLPQVHNAVWLDRVPSLNLFGLDESLFPRETASIRQMESSKERILKNPMAVGRFISDDARTIVMYLDLNWINVITDESCTTEIREAAEQAAKEIPGAKIDFAVTGTLPLDLMMSRNHVHNAMKYQLIGYSIMMISALILFRGLAAVVIVAIAPGFGVFWTMGWLFFFDLQDNPFNDIIVPVLISLVGLTDSVHLMQEIRIQRASGLPVREAMRRGVARVGLACFLTALTTAIGFISLLWAHHDVVREFGWCCVLGATMTFISVLTVIPLLCRSPLGKRLHIGYGRGIVDKHLGQIKPMVDWVVAHDRAVSYGAIGLTALLCICSWPLVPDEKRYSGLSESGEAARALRHLDQALGGLESGQILVRWNQTSSPEELLEVLEEVAAHLKEEPLLGHPLGLRELILALPGDGPARERVSLLELLPASMKRAFYDPDNSSATIQFRIQDLGIARYGPIFEKLEKKFGDIQSRHPHYSLSLEGDAAWRWRNIFRVVTDLAASLGTASVVIYLILTIAFRSVRLGLISLFPNIFPLAVTGAVLVLMGQHLEMVTVCVFTICSGLAVDDTIHFMSRYQEEQAVGGEHKETIRRAFGSVGAALLMTTFVLVTGMGTAIVSDARDARLFGIMGAFTLISALFGDLICLPALLSYFAKPKSK